MAAAVPLKSADDIGIDMIPLRVQHLSHAFQGVNVMEHVSLDLCQGKLHVLAGRRGSGKTTLLKLIGSRTLKQAGSPGFLVVPAHLRVLHISKEPLFFAGTLYENLTYGVQKGDKDGRLERVLNICKGLDIKDDVTKLISDDKAAEIARWCDVLSRSDCHLLNLARGLITSPEVLCVHKPSMGLGPNTVPVVFRMLRTFVRHKGVEQDLSRVFFRRPRTCIISFTTEVDLSYADEIHYPFTSMDDPSRKSTLIHEFGSCNK
jgi:ABC-type branched-subunit amino acid transport system ATPase component